MASRACSEIRMQKIMTASAKKAHKRMKKIKYASEQQQELLRSNSCSESTHKESRSSESSKREQASRQ